MADDGSEYGIQTRRGPGRWQAIDRFYWDRPPGYAFPSVQGLSDVYQRTESRNHRGRAAGRRRRVTDSNIGVRQVRPVSIDNDAPGASDNE